jgi:hypothetical protein
MDTQQKRGTDAQGRQGGPVSWSRRIGPPVPLSAGRERFPYVPVSRLPQRRDRVPFRCGLRADRAQRVKAAQEAARSGRGALVLALTAVLH